MKATEKMRGFFKQLFSKFRNIKQTRKQRKKMILDERIQEVKENERRLATIKRNMVSKRKQDAMPERPRYEGAKSFGTDYDIKYKAKPEIEYDDPIMGYSQKKKDISHQNVSEHIPSDNSFNDFYDEEEVKRQENHNPSVVRVSKEVPNFKDASTGYKSYPGQAKPKTSESKSPSKRVSVNSSVKNASVKSSMKNASMGSVDGESANPESNGEMDKFKVKKMEIF